MNDSKFENRIKEPATPPRPSRVGASVEAMMLQHNGSHLQATLQSVLERAEQRRRRR